MGFIIPILSAGLWRIGGWKYKVARRLILPALLGCYLASQNLIATILGAVALWVATTIPYGEGMRLKLKKWFRPYTFLVGASYGFAIALMKWPYSHQMFFFAAATSFVFGGMMWLSNKYNWFRWWFVEVATGFTVGLLATI